MNNSTRVILSALATLSLVGCGKEHAEDEANKQVTKAQASGQWVSPCQKLGALWEVAGLSSQVLTYDFYTNTGKTVQLFGEDNCAKPLAEVTYTGTATVGAPNPQQNNILDLNYAKVELKILDEEVVNRLNSPLTPGCGINDWRINEVRDVTSAAGGLNCPIEKPAQVFDILSTDGTTLKFGKADATHDKSTQEARPVEIDQSVVFSRK